MHATWSFGKWPQSVFNTLIHILAWLEFADIYIYILVLVPLLICLCLSHEGSFYWQSFDECAVINDASFFCTLAHLFSFGFLNIILSPSNSIACCDAYIGCNIFHFG